MADYDTALTTRQGAGCGIVACGEERRWGEERRREDPERGME